MTGTSTGQPGPRVRVAREREAKGRRRSLRGVAAGACLAERLMRGRVLTEEGAARLIENVTLAQWNARTESDKSSARARARRYLAAVVEGCCVYTYEATRGDGHTLQVWKYWA